MFPQEQILLLSTSKEEEEYGNDEIGSTILGAHSDDEKDEEEEEQRLQFDPRDLGQAGPVPSKMPQACLFVANLDASKPDHTLFSNIKRHFSQWGELSEVKIDRDSSNRPFAFVQFKNIAEAKKALVEAQHDLIDGREIRIEHAKVIRTLRIQYNLNWKPAALEKHFLSFGHIEDFKILRYPDTGDLKGILYVKYFSRADAILAYRGSQHMPKWSVEWDKPERKRSEVDYRSLFVGKLNPERISEPLLRAKFELYGEVEAVQLKTFPGWKNKPAIAFVHYSNESDAELAIDELHGSMWLDNIIKVEYREIGSMRKTYPRESRGQIWPVEQPLPQQLPSGYRYVRGFTRQSPQQPLNPTAPSFGPILNLSAQHPQHFFTTPPQLYNPSASGFNTPSQASSGGPSAPNTPFNTYQFPQQGPIPPFQGSPYFPPQQHPYQGQQAQPFPPQHQVPPGWQVVMVPVDFSGVVIDPSFFREQDKE
ncbi:hypothetical protein BDR26DRAFT_919681 [Obelidium mucronatum]|nr:hypothetical protein BDR26DRAFT_919681 [Obelidium mucronatum]